MKVIAAYLLASLTGEPVTESKLTAILSSVGVEADSSRVAALLKELEGKDIATVIAEGNSKLASVPSGGSAVASSGIGMKLILGAVASSGSAAPAEEEVKEEAKEEVI